MSKMSNIQEDRILRIHSPGYGTNGCLKEGSANPLDSYDVMIINPLSIIHLFESNDSELIEQINLASSQGLTNFNLSSDVILTDITKQLGKRIFELIEFLKKGGLLIYYLCRPFIVQSPSRNLDNYVWLNVLAPDMGSQDESETESPETTARHMSAISHGRNIDITDEGMQSDFVKYFQQQGLEWNTIIRENFLTEGYNCLAVAGSQKCISAYLVAGNNGGSIIFLPSPYSPDFDKVLIDCVNNWFNKRNNLFSPNQGTVEKTNQPSSVKSETPPSSENVVSNQTQEDYSAPNNQVLNSNVVITQNPSNYQPDNSEPIDYADNTDTSINNLANPPIQYQELDLNKTDSDGSAEKTNSLASRFERLKSNRINSSSLINKDKNPKTSTTENPLSSKSQDSYNTNNYTVPESVKQEFIASPNSIIQEIDTVISSTNSNLSMSLNDPTVKSFNPKDFNSVLPLADPNEANNLINSLKSGQLLDSDILNDTNFDSEFMLNSKNSSFTQTVSPANDTFILDQNPEPLPALANSNDTFTAHQTPEPLPALANSNDTFTAHQTPEPLSDLANSNDTVTAHQTPEPLSALANSNGTLAPSQAYTAEILYPTTSALTPESKTSADSPLKAIYQLNSTDSPTISQNSTPNDTVLARSPNQTDNELSVEKILNDEILKPIINNNFAIANQNDQDPVKDQPIEDSQSNEAIINDLMQQNQLSIAKFKEQQKINSETKKDSEHSNFNGLQELDSTLTSISQSNQQTNNSSDDWQIQLPPQGINSQYIKVEPSQSPDINFDFDLDIDLDFNIESNEEFSNLNIPSPVSDNNPQPQSFPAIDQLELKLPESDFKPDSNKTNSEEPTVTTNQSNAVQLSNNKQGDFTMNNNNENTNLTNTDKSAPSNPEPSTVNLTNEWIGHIIFPEITTIIDERTKLNHQINQIKNQISSLDNQLALYENIRNCLLCSHENELYNAVKMVFKKLNWSIQNNPQNNLENEFLLSEANKIFGLVRIAQSNSEIKRTEFASLAESVINYWNNTEIEPKGILVVSTWTNRPLSERMDPEFSTTLEEFATKKGICVITTAQLLSIFLSVDTKKINHSDVNNTYLNCNGKLPGFNLNYTDSHKIPASVK